MKRNHDDIDRLTNGFKVGCLQIESEIAPHGKQWMIFDPLSKQIMLIDKETATKLYVVREGA